MKRVILASDFHLSPDQPRGIEVFVRFTREVVAGADAFFVLGDLFNFWVGPANMKLPGIEPVLDALAAVAAEGTRVCVLHGNRDFLLGRAEARRIGATIPGEETTEELFGQRFLLLHGDSLCTLDVGYQKSKRWLRCGFLHGLSRILPLWACLRIARRMRSASRRSVSTKSREIMEIVPEAARERFEEGYDALICGHVHRPGRREMGTPDAPRPLYVLGDWHEGGVYGRIEEGRVRLERYTP